MKIHHLKYLLIHLCVIAFFFCTGISHTLAMQPIVEHPHILVNQQDRKTILEKISNQDWAGKIFSGMKSRLNTYVTRHKKDPEWILSRYLMNRIPGKRYTNFISDADGTQLISYSGDAPFPTVRVAPHKRPPISKDGYTYRQPAIEELVPNDTSMRMLMQVNSPDGRKEWADPQTFVDNINEKINALALDAAIIYWLSGDTSYARFAADILSQWARGAYHQNPIQGPCRTGFLSIQTLGDGSYEAMPLIYDFLYDYLRKNNYETKWYEPVFDKIAHTMTFRGFWNNNWFAAQTPALVFSAMALEDKTKKDYYLNFVTTKDTINGGCGHLSMPSVVKEWLTPDGHWKEPGGYHNFPVSSLLTASLALEKNGIPVFKDNPALLDASYVMMKYSFPNLQAPTFGDTGPASQSPLSLEIGLLMASNYQHPLLPQLTAAMKKLKAEKGYKREEADYLGLLCYLPQLPEDKSNPDFTWSRSGQLDFAKAYFQRNGSEPKSALMYVVQGATYNHNHANGMSVELYGSGTVMAPDPGNGLTYEDPMHVNYYAQWGAHNTVIAGGISGPATVFKGGGGAKKIGEIKLTAMEPEADLPAVSPNFSFTTTLYNDLASNTNQERTLAIIRTSANTGYYLDIYRSDHPLHNSYVYHNIGQDLQLLDSANKLITLTADSLPLAKKPFDPPGLRYIKNVQTTGEYNKNLTALFGIKDSEKDTVPRFMRAIYTGEEKRIFYKGMAPPTKTVTPQFRSIPTPTLVSHQLGEARTRPFIAVYEPFIGKNNNSVLQAECIKTNSSNTFTALHVKNKNNLEQFIFQSTEPSNSHQHDNWSFKGSFGLVHLTNGKLSELYLGKGEEIRYKGYSITSSTSNGSASVRISDDKLIIFCNQKTLVKVNERRFNVPPGAEYEIPLNQ